MSNDTPQQTPMTSNLTNFPAGMCALNDFDGAREAAGPLERLGEVRRRALALRERMMSEPEALCWRSFDLIRAPFPT